MLLNSIFLLKKNERERERERKTTKTQRVGSEKI
jgi:hypothetical protein